MQAALQKDVLSFEDFAALLSPAAQPFLEQMARRAKEEREKHFGNNVLLFTPLYLSVSYTHLDVYKRQSLCCAGR